MAALNPFLASPVLMEPAATQTLGFFGGTSGSGGFAPAYVPFLFNGALYQVLQTSQSAAFPDSPINVYKSIDQGNTWAIVGSGGPVKTDPTRTGGVVFDGNHTIVVAFMPTGGPTIPSTGPINLQNFDLNTGTWGAVYGTVGAPAVWEVGPAFVRPDGSIIVFAAPNLSGGNVVNCTAYVFQSGAWASNFPADTNVPGGLTATANLASVIDSTGNVHLFMIAVDLAHVANTQLIYQLVKTDNTLGTHASIQSGSAAGRNLPGVPEMSPCIAGNSVVIGVVDFSGDFATISVGTPLSSPVFTLLGSPGIDPVLPTTFQRLFAPAMAADASGIWGAYMIESSVDQSITMRLCFSPNVNAPLTGWTESILAFDGNAFPGSAEDGWDFLSITRDAGNLFASAMDVLSSGPGQPSNFWLGVFSPVLLPAATPGLGGGVGHRSSGCGCSPDLLAAERLRQKMRRRDAWPYRYLFPPDGSSEVNVFGELTGLGVGSLGVVLTYRVPGGFRFFLEGLIQDFTSPVQPGEAVWTVDLNASGSNTQAMAVQGLQAVPIPLGSIANGFQWFFERPYEFASLNMLRSTVRNMALGSGVFTSGFFGYLVSDFVY